MKELKAGYYAEVTEHEWGQRHDGYLICIEKERGEARAKCHGGYVCRWDEGFSEAGDFNFCLLTEEAIYDIKKAGGTVWIPRGSFDKYVAQY